MTGVPCSVQPAWLFKAVACNVCTQVCLGYRLEKGDVALPQIKALRIKTVVLGVDDLWANQSSQVPQLEI